METKTKIPRYLTVIFVVCGLLLLFSFFAPVIFTLRWGWLDFSKTGEIGDTISGTMSPFIAIIGVIFTFAAFYVQYQFNAVQRREIEEQRDVAKNDMDKQRSQIAEQSLANNVTNFERSLFEMLNLHQRNRDTIIIGTENDARANIGIDAIVYVNADIRTIYHAIMERDPEHDHKGAAISAYLFVYYGRALLENETLRRKYLQIIERSMPVLDNYGFNTGEHANIKSDGYGIYLSRYFRLLFQIYAYIDDAMFLDETSKSRYFYSKIVRSSLSMEEQILLFYNFISPLGQAWVTREYVLKYKIIRNLPIGMLDTYSPIKWLKSLGRQEIDYEYISEYFEFYDDE